MSDSLRPHGLYSSWKSPGQNTAFPFSRGSSQPRDWTQVSCIVSRFFTSWTTRGSPRVLEWVAYPFSRGSLWPRNWTGFFCIAGRVFTNWAIRKPSEKRFPKLQNRQRRGSLVVQWLRLCLPKQGIWVWFLVRRDQIANICWIMEKARELQKNIYFCFIDYAKAFDCVDHNKLCKILKEMGIPDRLVCLLRNVYAGQEATWLGLDMEQQTGSK